MEEDNLEDFNFKFYEEEEEETEEEEDGLFDLFHNEIKDDCDEKKELNIKEKKLKLLKRLRELKLQKEAQKRKKVEPAFIYNCPICQTNVEIFNANDRDYIINSHIDQCLNQSALVDMEEDKEINPQNNKGDLLDDIYEAEYEYKLDEVDEVEDVEEYTPPSLESFFKPLVKEVPDNYFKMKEKELNELNEKNEKLIRIKKEYVSVNKKKKRKKRRSSINNIIKKQNKVNVPPAPPPLPVKEDPLKKQENESYSEYYTRIAKYKNSHVNLPIKEEEEEDYDDYDYQPNYSGYGSYYNNNPPKYVPPRQRKPVDPQVKEEKPHSRYYNSLNSPYNYSRNYNNNNGAPPVQYKPQNSYSQPSYLYNKYYNKEPPVLQQPEPIPPRDLGPKPPVPDKFNENPFIVLCPYDYSCGWMEARDLPTHVKNKHSKESDHRIGCPICELMLGQAYPIDQNTNLLLHLEQTHSDMVPTSEDKFEEEVWNEENLSFDSIGDGYVEDILSIDIEKECTVCFEEFYKNEHIIRMECLCIYHKECINGWFKKIGKNSCPVHVKYDDTTKR